MRKLLFGWFAAILARVVLGKSRHGPGADATQTCDGFAGSIDRGRRLGAP
jgi:hypothetical protein